MNKFTQQNNISGNQLNIYSNKDKRNLEISKFTDAIIPFFELLIETDQKLKSKKNHY